MEKIFSLALLIFWTSVSFCQVEFDNASELSIKYGPKKYLEDLDQLVTTLISNHPIPFEFIGKKDFNSNVSIVRSQIDENTTLGDFYWKCRQVVSSIGCGHTRLSISNFGFPDSLRYPLIVKYLDSTMIVLDPLNNNDIVFIGDEIESINGWPVSELRNQIYQHLSADGYNLSYKRVYGNKYFSSYCAYQLEFPLEYRIKITGRREEILLRQSSFDIQRTKSGSCIERLCLDKISEETYLMTIKGFGFYGDSYGKFESFVDDAFNKFRINGIKNLILDLRGNTGGDPRCGAYLIKQVTNKPVSYFSDATLGYDLLKEPLLPKPDRFKGELYILMDGECFSTTAHLLSLLKYHDLGTLVGEESGGTYTCNDNSRQIELRNTGLSLRIARNVYQTAVSGMNKNEGVKPDIEIIPTKVDLINGNNKAMEETLAIINAKN